VIVADLEIVGAVARLKRNYAQALGNKFSPKGKCRSHGKTENIRCAAIRDGLAYAWGRPPQPIDGDGAGGPIIIKIITQVPGPDDD
jgi:hypothetical protein